MCVCVCGKGIQDSPFTLFVENKHMKLCAIKTLYNKGFARIQNSEATKDGTSSLVLIPNMLDLNLTTDHNDEGGPGLA